MKPNSVDAAKAKRLAPCKTLMKPPVWDKMSGKERMDCINGCGGQGAWYNVFVPDHIGIVDVYPACGIHDVCYATGYPKIRSDAMLLYNLILLCCVGPKYLWVLRCLLAIVFYLAVAMFGGYFYERKTGRKRQKPQRGRGHGSK